jgi:hypothetical protein
MSKSKREPLLRAADHLEHELASRWEEGAQTWLDAVREALTEMDGILFRLSVPSERQLLAPVEAPQRDLSPRLAREVESLRGELRHMTEQVNTLLVKVHGAPGDHAVFQELRHAGEKLVTAVRAFHEAENKLVIETALRDTGAGD